MAFRGRDQEAYERVQRLLEWPMIVLSLVFVAVVMPPLVADLSDGMSSTLEGVAWLIWALFAAEYLLLLWLAPDRWLMFRTHLLDLAIVLLPFLRPLRAARALRLLRTVALFGRFGVGVRRLFGRRGFTPFLVIVAAVIASAGVGVWLVEHDAADGQITTMPDGLWWALVTSTTVGYGDVVPVTDVGRGIATLLMLVGVALLSVVTANIAAFFVEDTEGQHEQLMERLDRLEAILQVQAGRDST